MRKTPGAGRTTRKMDAAVTNEEKRVIVCGYPKSGNTWACRLIAEALDCPVKGFLGEDNRREIAQEGADRVSEYGVYKAHHLHKMMVDHSYHALIYIVRDVRDVVVSGAHYFKLAKYNEWRDRRGEPHEDDPYEAMTHTAIHGGIYSHCRRPWGRHVKGYLKNGAFHIRYEDLLARPEATLTAIGEQVGRPIDPVHMKTAIRNQSFDAAKARFAEAGQTRKANFLRQGRSGGYKDALSADQIARLNQAYGPLLERLGYTV